MEDQNTQAVDNKLYVGNLSYQVNDEALAKYFAEAGEVVEAKVIVDKMSGRSKGFGFVTMADAEMAKKAMECLMKKKWTEENPRFYRTTYETKRIISQINKKLRYGGVFCLLLIK
jgi:RNA recognition motif-containing protein